MSSKGQSREQIDRRLTGIEESMGDCKGAQEVILTVIEAKPERWE